jgi:hypothetical protein
VRAKDQPTYPGKPQLAYAGQLWELSQKRKFLVILLLAVRASWRFLSRINDKIGPTIGCAVIPEQFSYIRHIGKVL